MLRQIGGLHIAIGISVQETLARTGIETQPGPSTVEELDYVGKNGNKNVNSKNGIEKAITQAKICFYCLWKGNLQIESNCPMCGGQTHEENDSTNKFHNSLSEARSSSNSCRKKVQNVSANFADRSSAIRRRTHYDMDK